jgi:hypothetical protein
MSKVLRIQKGGYKIIAESGSEIRLDSGPSGQVTVTGNLVVDGGLTYINVSDLQIEDRIIKLNRNETANTITPQNMKRMSGLEIERGNADVLMVFDEIPYQPVNNSFENLLQPSFTFKGSDNSLVPITTSRIQTYGAAPNKDLTFFTGLEGLLKVEIPGPLSIGPTTITPVEYHTRLQVLNTLDPTEADKGIPNLKFIKEYVRAEAGEAVIEKFYRYTETNEITWSGAEAKDVTANDEFSGVQFLAGVGDYDPIREENNADQIARMGRFSNNQFGLLVGPGNPSQKNIKILRTSRDDSSAELQIKTENADLTIQPSTGNLILKSVLKIEHLNGALPNPVPTSAENVIFSRTDQGSGGTGLYFANSTSVGELCSAANALVYGLIF